MPLTEHLQKHPTRVLVTLSVVVVLSWAIAAWSVVVALDAQQDAARENAIAICKQVNELRRSIFIAAGDLDLPRPIRLRFLPTQSCEDLE